MLKRKVIKGGIPPGAPTPSSSANANANVKQQQHIDEEDADTVEETVANEEDDSLAAAFDAVSLSSSASEIPPGKYEAVISRITLQDPDAKGRSVRVNFELCAPKFENKNQLVTWFKILESDHRTPVDGGVKAFKAMLAKLGYEPKGNEMREAMQEINDEKPGVMLKISYQQANDGNTYQRIIVDSTCENDLVEAYKDNVPY